MLGTTLTKNSLNELLNLWRPALVITITLILTGITIGLWTSRLLGVDPVVSLLGSAPRGISLGEERSVWELRLPLFMQSG